MNYMTMEKLEALLSGIDGARVALIGDFCLDVYWTADMKQSELSRETPHFPCLWCPNSILPAARAMWPAT